MHIFLSLQKRATIRTQDYSYHPIVNTPFTLGIALPRDYGKFRVKGELEVSLAKFNSKYLTILELGEFSSNVKIVNSRLTINMTEKLSV